MSEAPAIRWDNEVVSGGQGISVRALRDRAAARLTTAPEDGPLAIFTDSPLDAIAAACWLASATREGMIVPRARATEAVSDRLREAGFGSFDLDASALRFTPSRRATPGIIHLLTSGSTGEPKWIRHTWSSLFTMSRMREPRPLRWLLTYEAGTYAWYQIVTALLFLPRQSVVVASGESPSEWLETAAANGVEAISSTPTFWRIALLQTPAAAVEALRRSLRQITLGGEPVDQAILDALRALFPSARLVHIYASSEAGASIVVTDGIAGFPAAWLAEPPGETRMRVQDGHLWIRSTAAAIGFEDWTDTGDVAEIRANRVLLLGRESHAFINVGGAKALVADIERALLAHPYVSWCRVSGTRAPLVGQLVRAEIVPRAERAGEPIPEAELTAHCAARLAPHMVPRVWVRLDRIPASVNWKTEVEAS